MPVNPDDPTIPVGCEDVAIIDAESDLCAPELNYGPIRNLYFTRAPFAAVPTAVEIARRKDLATSAPTDPEALTGPFVCVMTQGGGTDEGEPFNGVTLAKPTTRTYPVSTKETSPKNVALAERTQKGGYPTLAFGVDSSNYWHGGQTGIGHKSGNLKLRLVIPEDFGAAQTVAGDFTVPNAYFDGKRIPSPVPVV